MFLIAALAQDTTNKSICKRSRTETTTRGKRNSFDSISSSESLSSPVKKSKIRYGTLVFFCSCLVLILSTFNRPSKEIETVVAPINLDLISSDSDDDCSADKR